MNAPTEYKTIVLDFKENVVEIKLNRPKLHNAFNSELIEELFDVFCWLRRQEKVRIIILTGVGDSFCAGADLNWMKSLINNTYHENYLDALKLAETMYAIYSHPKPVIAKVNGSTFGGGIGLMAVCDIIVASDSALFALTEVKLGLVPAVISPYVIKRIGEHFAREYFITGDKFSAEKALKMNLLNYAVPKEELDLKVDSLISKILSSGPEAVKTAKRMITRIPDMTIPEVQEYTAKLIADVRTSSEGQEGMQAFLDKRKPNWF